MIIGSEKWNLAVSDLKKAGWVIVWTLGSVGATLVVAQLGLIDWTHYTQNPFALTLIASTINILSYAVKLLVKDTRVEIVD